jgi:GntR family transcriptional regulator
MASPTHIDRYSTVALHLQCRDLLLAFIERGEIKPGEMIPPERVLCERYGLSRITVRAAIDDLVQQGVLRRAQGKGTFVTHRALPLDLHKLTSFTEDMRARGKQPSSKLLELGMVQPAPRIAEALSTHSTVQRITRLRYADGQIMGLHDTYLPGAFTFQPEDFREDSSLHRLMLARYNTALVTAEETLQAIALQDDQAALLDTSPGAPALEIERISYDPEGYPVEYCLMIYRAEHYKYYARLVRRD